MVKKSSACVIAIDGPDGVGKTTQIELLIRKLRTNGQKVHQTRASGGTPIGEALRRVSLADIPRPAIVDFYISLAMHTALGLDIQKRKATGETIVIDRSPLAIVAYNGYGSDVPNKQPMIDEMLKLVKLWEIDKLIVLSADSETLLSRRQQRHKKSDYFEKQDSAYHQRVTKGYQAAFKSLQAYRNTMVYEIDASGSIATVHQTILDVLK